MKKLKMYPVSAIEELARPVSLENMSLFTPALAFFTDFNLTEPLVIDASVSATEARAMMIKTHVRLKFVVDKNNHFIGIVTADDLAERKIVQRVAAGIRREEVSITDLMTPRNKLLALDIEEVKTSTIADVVGVLKDSHQQHCLVIDQKSHRIRGIFSASDISRKLKLPINIQEHSDFYRVFSAIA